MQKTKTIYIKSLIPLTLSIITASATATATATYHPPGCQNFPQFGCYASGILCSTVPEGKKVELGKPNNGSLVLFDKGNDGTINEIFYLTRNHMPDSFSYTLKGENQASLPPDYKNKCKRDEKCGEYYNHDYQYNSKADKDQHNQHDHQDHYEPIHDAGTIYVDPNSCDAGGGDDNGNNGNNGNSP